MNDRVRALVILAVATAYGLGDATAAETLRNPPGTPAPSTTMRNPLATGAAPQRADSKAEPAVGTAPTRPSKGSDIAAPKAATFGASGPVSERPGTPSAGTVGNGVGAPNLNNPAGANGATTPTGLSTLRPNGGAAENGSKAAPMQENGVRKVE